jgi:hypothetical protein
MTGARSDPAFTIELSDEEILEDLCWPSFSRSSTAAP